MEQLMVGSLSSIAPEEQKNIAVVVVVGGGEGKG
jgi:hypothetical protein